MWKKAKEIGEKRRGVSVVKLGGKVNRTGEGGGKGEDIGEDTGSYLEGEGNLSSDMEEEIYGEEGEGKTGEGFAKDFVTWSSNLLIISKTSFRARLFRRFRIRLNCTWDLRWRGTCRC